VPEVVEDENATTRNSPPGTLILLSSMSRAPEQDAHPIAQALTDPPPFERLYAFLTVEFYLEGLWCHYLSFTALVSSDTNQQDPLTRPGQELLLPSQFCTLVESKRGGYAASHLDAMTLAVPAKFTLQLLLWEQPLGARKP
jgi:hypothetical protein